MPYFKLYYFIGESSIFGSLRFENDFSNDPKLYNSADLGYLIFPIGC